MLNNLWRLFNLICTWEPFNETWKDHKFYWTLYNHCGVHNKPKYIGPYGRICKDCFSLQEQFNNLRKTK